MKGTLAYRVKWSNTTPVDLTCVGFSLGGHLIAYGGGDELTIASAEEGDIKSVVQHQGATVVALEWLSDNILVCAFDDGTLVNLSLHPSNLGMVGLLARSHEIQRLSTNIHKNRLASGAGSDVRIWKFGRGGRWFCSTQLGSPCMFQDNIKLDVVINSMHWRNEVQNHLLVSYKYHGVQIWDVDAASVVTSVLNTSTPLGTSSLSPDQKYLAIVMQSGIDVHDIAVKLPTTSLPTLSGLDSPVLFVHNGEAVAAVYSPGRIRFWGRSTGTRLQTLEYSAFESVYALAESHYAKARLFRIAMATSSGVRIWETVDVGPRVGTTKINAYNVSFVIALILGAAVTWISAGESIW